MAGTEVALANGSHKAIEQIRPGDHVLTRDQNASDRVQVRVGTVSRTFTHVHPDSLLLKFADGSTIHTTAPHPFYVHGKGFVHAGDLRVGDKVSEKGQALDAVVAIVRLSSPQRIYNFEVAREHTYFVCDGHAWLWVHNNCRGSGDALPIRDGPKNGSLVSETGEGKGTIRKYDGEGNAQSDFDFGHNHGVGDPHAHDWDWSGSKPRRLPGRPLGTWGVRSLIDGDFMDVFQKPIVKIHLSCSDSGAVQAALRAYYVSRQQPSTDVEPGFKND